MTKTVFYYFTPASGYAYLGHEKLKAVVQEAGATISYRPMLILKVFEASNTTPPPKQSEARLNYRRADMKRWADLFGLPLNIKPKFWPAPDILAGRAVIAAESVGADPHAVAGALLQGVWAKDMNIADVDDVTTLISSAGLPAGDILAAAETDAVIATQDQYTEEAIEKGVFGSPTFVVDGEIFWGQDRIDFVASRLG